jgi:hypothetical protein
MIHQSEILNCSWVQFITLFFGGAQLCCASHGTAVFTSHGKLREFGVEKAIS